MNPSRQRNTRNRICLLADKAAVIQWLLLLYHQIDLSFLRSAFSATLLAFLIQVYGDYQGFVHLAVNLIATTFLVPCRGTRFPVPRRSCCIAGRTDVKFPGSLYCFLFLSHLLGLTEYSRTHSGCTPVVIHNF